jgi:hypothetical protein
VPKIEMAEMQEILKATALPTRLRNPRRANFIYASISEPRFHTGSVDNGHENKRLGIHSETVVIHPPALQRRVE